jgi:dihydrofolate synthase / folylpolyglutamate synthase
VATPPFHSLSEALAWLDAHINYEATAPSARALPTLAPMVELAHLLGDPQEAYPSVHVTGTNGKGSTAAMVTALFGAMGLRVGTYTSPNLSRVNERIALDSHPIDDEPFREVLGSLAALESMLTERPTRFALLTAAALAWFADEAVDAAVIEVGLGGTWDCTNVVDGRVAVLTNVSYDHTDVLGPTLEGIAADKAGIIKEGSVAVIGETAPELVDIITARARSVGATAWVAGRDFECTANRLAIGGRLLDLRTPAASYGEILVSLHGPHQGRNAACALAAAEAFFGGPLDEAVVEEAFSQVRVPGRLEVVGRAPLTLVDGAHNVEGMTVLAGALREGFSVAGDTVVVLGMLRGRDPSAMLAALAPAGVDLVVACAPVSPRALDAEVVAEAARALGLNVVVAPSVADAVATARAAVPDDGLLVAAGSLYVVAEARQLLLEQTAAGSALPPA